MENRTTTDHEEIRRWAEERGGRPAAVVELREQGGRRGWPADRLPRLRQRGGAAGDHLDGVLRPLRGSEPDLHLPGGDGLLRTLPPATRRNRQGRGTRVPRPCSSSGYPSSVYRPAAPSAAAAPEPPAGAGRWRPPLIRRILDGVLQRLPQRAARGSSRSPPGGRSTCGRWPAGCRAGRRRA